MCERLSWASLLEDGCEITRAAAEEVALVYKDGAYAIRLGVRIGPDNVVAGCGKGYGCREHKMEQRLPVDAVAACPVESVLRRKPCHCQDVGDVQRIVRYVEAELVTQLRWV